MKKIILKNLTLRNFRGEKEKTVNFNTDKETSVYGANGVGKTRLYDAFMWLLFGKDTQDRKDYNVRTIEGNEPLHRVECSVSAIFLIDNEEINIKRAFNEKWIKPRGQDKEIFKGNETECFWNDVPITVTDYQKRINEIVNETVFKMITNPHYFVNMKWQYQREHLFQIAGTVSDEEIIRNNPELSILLDKISGKSFADFKKELLARKRRLKEELEQIQPKIDQTQKLMPEEVDFAALEWQIKEIENEIAKIDKAILDKTEASRQNYEAIQKKQSEINTLKQQQQKLLFEAQNKERENVFLLNSKRQEIVNNILTLDNEVKKFKQDIEFLEKDVNEKTKAIEEYKKEIAELRKRWFEENSIEFKGENTCQLCGQQLPESMKKDAERLFYELKKEKLAKITTDGVQVKNKIAELEKNISETQKNIENKQAEVLEKEKLIFSLRNELSIIPVLSEKTIIKEEISGYMELSEQIEVLEAEIKVLESGSMIDTGELKIKKQHLQNELSKLQIELSNRDLIKKYKEEIKQLEQQGKELAQAIATAEGEEFLIRKFTKIKINECESRINNLFSFVTFRLFDYTLEGDEIETCVSLVNGVPFDVANTAGQINAGLDIINTLVKFYGVSAPIFIDRRESVNELIPTQSQIINLIVTKDKFLNVE